MRRRLHLLTVLSLIVVVLLAAMPSEAIAKTKKRATCVAYDVTAVVSNDGSLLVTEVRTIEYKGAHTSLCFAVGHGSALFDTCGVEVRDAGEIVDGEQCPYSSVTTSSRPSGSGSYYVNETTSPGLGMTRVDMRFHKGSGTARFYVTYRIDGCVARWADVGELCWTFVGSTWDVDTNNARLEAYLPAPAGFVVEKGENVWAWLHNESLVGEARINEGEVPPVDARTAITAGTVVCEAALVQKGKRAEVRALFPAEWLTSMEARADRRRPVVTQEEATLAAEASALRSSGSVASYAKLAIEAVLVLASITVVVVARKRLGSQHGAHVDEPLRKGVPADDHPAVFARLVTYDPTNPSALAATLLRLADQRIVSLDHLRGDYRLTLDRISAREIDNPIDAGLVSLLFDFVAQSVRTSTPHDPNARPTNRLLLSDVVDVARKNKRRYSKRLAAWGKTVEAATDSKGYSNGWSTWKKVFLALGCVDVAVAMLAIMDWGIFNKSAYVAAGIPYAVILACFEALFGVGMLVFRQPLSLPQLAPKGLEVSARLGAFASWLRDGACQDDAASDDAGHWSRVLEVAVALDVEDEVARRLQEGRPRVATSDELACAMSWCTGEDGSDSPIHAFRDGFAAAARAAAQ